MASNVLSKRDGPAKGPSLPPLSPKEEERSTRNLTEFTENAEWFTNNREEIRAKYADMFVAVYGRAVAMADADLRKLSDRVMANYGQDSAAFVTFIPKVDAKLIV